MNRYSAFLVVLLVALATSRPVKAQSTEDFQVWAGGFFTGDLFRQSPGPAAWLDVHARRGSSGTTVILRPGVGFNFAPWLSVWAGYAWVPVFADATGGRTDEHRIWEQLILQHGVSGFTLQSRTRLEQRFSDNSGDVGLRLREFVRVNYRPSAAFPLGIAFWDEVFFGLVEADWNTHGFDQNRVFLGPAIYTLDGALRIEAGYLLAVLNREPTQQIQHVLAVNFFGVYKPTD